MAENDGTFRCKPCRQPLNETDVNCWRCGSKDIEDLRPKEQTLDLGELILADQSGVEEVLRSWGTQTYSSGTATSTGTWTLTAPDHSDWGPFIVTIAS